MADNLLMGVIALLILMVVGVAVVLPTITDFTNRASSLQTAVNETISCVNGTTATLTYNDLTSATVVMVGNTSQIITSGNYSVTASTGRIWFIQITNAVHGNTCRVTYTYTPDEYLSSGSSRTVVQIIPLLIVIALIVAVISYYKFR
jgi:hypothetical protein